MARVRSTFVLPWEPEVLNMPTEIKLRRTGGSISATLPKAMVERFHLEAGDPVFAIETEEGILLTPYDSQLEAAMRVYGDGARKYRHALHELGK
jgi:putative addiction module antidote